MSVLRSQFARFRVPEQIKIDNRSQFEEFERFTKANSTHYKCSISPFN